MKRISTEINTAFFKWILLLPFLGIFATVFILGENLSNGIVTGKYFWFYGSMGFVGAGTVIVSLSYRNTYRFTIADLFVCLFTVSVYLSALVFNSASGNMTKLTIFALLFVLYFCFRLFFSVFEQKESVLAVMCFFLILTGLVEAVWGLLQLYGFKYSQHGLFRLTGSFFNPGPYAGYLAVIFPLALDCILNKSCHIVQKWASALACIATVVVLPAAMSRASWLAVIAGSLVVWYFGSNELGKNIKAKISRLGLFVFRPQSWIFAIVIVLLISFALTGMYLLKKNSADGRVLMWKISIQSVMKHPLGVGLGNFSNAYGEAQSAYIAGGTASETEKYVAGTPEYGFNEYLQIMVESGWVSFLLFLGMTVCVIRSMLKSKQEGLMGSLVALLIFAFFSYPFSVLPVLIVFTFLLSASSGAALRCSRHSPIQYAIAFSGLIITFCCLYKQYPVYHACKQWEQKRMYYHSGMNKDAVREYAKFYPYLQDDIKFLFEYAQSLSKTGEYEKSNEILRRAMQISCDPMLYNVMGKNYQALKQYKLAEQSFQKAINLVPNRLYPHYLLAKLYHEMGLKDKADAETNIVLTKPPKVKSMAVDEMRKELKMLRK
jgi:tetratricopeptide (TPR) repeat protein